MNKTLTHDRFVVGNGNRIKSFVRLVNQALHHLNRIYFPEEHEFESRLQEFLKKKSIEKKHIPKN